MNYHLTKKAIQDLNNIWNYTFDKWSEKQADCYYFDLLNKCKEIGGNPNLGKPYDGISKNLLGIKINKHIIFYRILEGAPIEITRVLHSSMDLKKRIVE